MLFYKCTPIKIESQFKKALKQLGYTPGSFKFWTGLVFRDVKGVCFSFDSDQHIPPVERERYYFTERVLTFNNREKTVGVESVAATRYQGEFYSVKGEGLK